MEPLILIAGPCVIESYETCAEVAGELARIRDKHSDGVRIFFKSSIDKANRSSIDSYRGVGWDEGIEILERINDKFRLPITTDFHTSDQVCIYGRRVDVIQIPALLSRQTDLISAAAMVAVSIVNVKKGQFLAPGDVKGIIEKAKRARQDCEVWITERGSCFGYGKLIVDFTGIGIIKQFADKVIVDCTHSNNGDRAYSEVLMKCAIASGADGIFVEVHPNPDSAKCDGPNSLKLENLGRLVEEVIKVRNALVRE